MYWHYSGDIWFFVVGALSTLPLVVFAWPRRQLSTIPYFIAGSSLVFLWCVLAILELLATDLRLIEGIGNAQYIPIPLTCLMWFLFALSFTRRKSWITWKLILALVAIPIVTMVLALTNSFHHWMFGPGELINEGGSFFLVRSYHSWFWVHTIHCYALVFAGSSLIIAYVIKKGPIYRRQGSVMIIGALIPFVANIFFLGLKNQFIHLDVTPVAMAFASVFFAWGIFKYRLFDLVPIARST
ncbi:unnamed protein product, partial [Laminaria digitata]